MANERILVVDDEPYILDACTAILKKCGFNVTAFDSGLEALNLIALEDFDLLLTDVRMPHVSGLDIIRFFKKREPCSAAVVITGEGTMDAAVQAIGIGADGFVSKPFSKQELINVINSSLEKVRLVRENIRLKSILPLFEVSKSLMQKVDMDDLLSTVINVSQQESGADSVSIVLKEDGRFLTGGLLKCFPDKPDRGYNMIRGEGPLEEVAMSGRSLLLRDDDENNCFGDGMKRYGVSSILILPLRAADEILGVMTLTKLAGNLPRFVKSDRDFMTILAGQAATALKNSSLVDAQRRLFMSTVKSLSTAIDTKSRWTAGHSERVTAYALMLGEELGLRGTDMKTLELAGLLHDIGKIGTSEDVLNKPDRLDENEYCILKNHPAAGAEIISHIEQMQDIIPVIRHHHEQYDGTGYPDGIAGDEIPLLARILAVADAFDAMKADRPYRKGKKIESIIDEFEKCSGSQFDPAITSAFTKALKNIK